MKKIIIYTLFGVMVSAGVVGCQVKTEDNSAENSSEQSKAEIENSISEQNKAFMSSFESGDAEGLAQVYFEHGWMMPPNAEPIKGREGVKQFLNQGKEMGLDRVEFTSEELFIHGDSVAIETGSYTTFAGGNQVDNGTFMVYWKKNGATWRMFRDIWNSDIPADSQEQ